MKFIVKQECLLLSKIEFEIIASIVVSAFSLQVDWWHETIKNKEIFRKEFEEKFKFTLLEFYYLEDELCELRNNLVDVDIKEVSLFISQEKLLNKALVIFTALNECSKNYDDYEVSTIAGVSKQELDEVLKDFKEKVIDVIKNTSEEGY